MKKQTLKFLYTRLKTLQLSREQAESKVCQEIFISKISANNEIRDKVVFKGGIIIDSLSKGKRGYTKDIDFDLIKYPLSNNGLSSFIEILNNSDSYQNIKISINVFQELRHKHYKGKRLLLEFFDGTDSFHLTVDVGVYLPIVKKNKLYKYAISFGESATILVNPIERIVAEKLSTFAIYGDDNTRTKDLFDAFFLITNFKINRKIVFRILNKMLVVSNHFYSNLDYAFSVIRNTLMNKEYLKRLEVDEKNWMNISIKIIVATIIGFLNVN